LREPSLKLISDMKTPTYTPKLTKKQVLAIPALYKKHGTIQKVASLYDVSWQCGWYWTKKLKVKTHNQGRRGTLETR